MNKMFLAALLAISGGSIATADTLLGRVADSEGNPVEFATVVALSTNHEQGGAVTDSIGNYRINLPKGQYNVTFTLVGYDNAEKAVTVSGETRLDATMTTNAVALHGVEVKASAIRRLPDRFVVRVEDMPAAIGKDGKELLQAAPGVWIDDKKITINGKSGAKVMVNDRELRMDQSQLLTYLRSLKAEDVSKIEVIPQAGAEYSADTAGGIIKITLKRNRADGVMGNVSLIGSVSKTSATVTPSASINVKNGKWTFSANSNLSASPKSYFDTGETTDYANGDRYTTDTKMDLHKSLFGYGMAGIYFDPNARNSLGIEVAYDQFLSPSDVTTNAAFNHTDIGIETMNGNYMSTSRHRNIDATFNYVHRLDSIGSQMKVIANYNHTKGRSVADNHRHSEFLALSADSISTSRENSVFDVVNVSYDYDKTFNSRWSLSTGLKYNLNRMDNDASYLYLKDHEWLTPDGRDYDVVFKENIYAAYVKASAKLGRFMASAGLRGELTDASSRGNIVAQRYFDLFPNANVTYLLSPNGSNVLTAQYSRSIARPSFWALNPERHQASDMFYQSGNSDLKPSYSDNVSLTGVVKYKYSLTLFANINHDQIIKASMPDKDNPKNVLLTMVNFDKQYMFGASLNLPFQIKDWWTLTANLTYLANGERREQKGSLTYHNFLNWYASSGFQLPKDFYFEISYYGQNKITMGEITVTPTHNLNASLKKSFAKRRWTASVGVDNILGRGVDFSIDSASGYHTKSKFSNPVSFSCSLTYNFSLGKAFQTRRVDSNNDASRLSKQGGMGK